jgi:hypothetical protein
MFVEHAPNSDTENLFKRVLAVLVANVGWKRKVFLTICEKDEKWIFKIEN